MPAKRGKPAKGPKAAKGRAGKTKRAHGTGRAGEVAAKRAPAREAPDWTAFVDAVTVPVDTTVYPMEVIYGAAYIFLNRAHVHLCRRGPSEVAVRLAGKTDLGREGLRSLGGEFANELLNQALRVTLDESGRKIREYIIAKAHFFQEQGGRDVQKLLDTTMQEAFDEDPLDIAVPWEEKYGRQDPGKG